MFPILTPTKPEQDMELTLALINEEIDNALGFYPSEIYQLIFANPEFRQKLIDYIIKEIQEYYQGIERQKQIPVKTKFPYRSLELRLQVEKYVHWGIESILGVSSEGILNRISQEPQPDYSPVYWFA